MPLTRTGKRVKGINSLKGYSIPTGAEIDNALSAGDAVALAEMQSVTSLAVRAEQAESDLAQAKEEIALTKAPASKLELALMFVSSRLGISILNLLKWRSDKAEDRAFTKRSVEDAIARYGSELPHYDDGECITAAIGSDFTATCVKDLVDQQHHDFVVEGVSFEGSKELIKMCREKRKDAGHAEGVKSLERIQERIKTHGDVVMTHTYRESRNGTIKESSTATYNRPLPKGPVIKEKTNVKAVEARIADAIASLV